MVFRKALLEEKDIILSLYKKVIGTNNCTWNEYYPCMDNIIDDINHEDLFVLEENNIIIGAISINPENEMDGFDEWKEINALEFARVIIDPIYQNKGYAKILVENIIKEIKNRNMKAIHIAVAKGNVIANKLYNNFAFVNVGEKEMYDNEYYLLEMIF